MIHVLYEIKQVSTGRVYIGISSNPRQRARKHFVDLKAGKHSNPRLQKAYQLAGPNDFTFAVRDSTIADTHWAALAGEKAAILEAEAALEGCFNLAGTRAQLQRPPSRGQRASGTPLAQLLGQYGVTPYALARAARLPQPTVYAIAKGQRQPRPATLAALLAGLEGLTGQRFSVADLLEYQREG